MPKLTPMICMTEALVSKAVWATVDFANHNRILVEALL